MKLQTKSANYTEDPTKTTEPQVETQQLKPLKGFVEYVLGNTENIFDTGIKDLDDVHQGPCKVLLETLLENIDEVLAPHQKAKAE